MLKYLTERYSLIRMWDYIGTSSRRRCAARLRVIIGAKIKLIDKDVRNLKIRAIKHVVDTLIHQEDNIFIETQQGIVIHNENPASWHGFHMVIEGTRYSMDYRSVSVISNLKLKRIAGMFARSAYNVHREVMVEANEVPMDS